MPERLGESGAGVTGAWLYVAELVHRVGNDYAAALAALRLAGRSSSGATGSAIREAERRLDGFAAAHLLLRPPVGTGRADLAAHLAQLCRAIAAARFGDRPITLSVGAPHPILLDPIRCWQAGLVVSELITNAARHAFSRDDVEGEVGIRLAAAHGQVGCEVSDTGRWTEGRAPGLGTAVVEALAADLGGFVVRRTGTSGSAVELIFPTDTEAADAPTPAWIAVRAPRALTSRPPTFAPALIAHVA